MEFTKKEAFAIQIGHYLRNKEYSKACGLAEGMLKKFPDEPLSHFMAAKSYYFAGNYEKAQSEGRKAYALSPTRQDMLRSAVVAASSLFMLKKYDEGHKMLLPFEKEDNEDVKKLLVIFYAVKGKGNKAGEYYKELYNLNMDAARKFIKRLAEAQT